MRIYFGCLVLLILHSCSKVTLSENGNEHPLVGKWILVETCFSPGDASLICNPPEFATSLTIQDNWDFKFSQGDMQCSGSVETEALEGLSQIHFLQPDAGCEGLNRSYFYQVEGQKLNLNIIGCIEPCIVRYERTN